MDAMASAIMATMVRLVAMEGAGWVVAVFGVASGVAGVLAVGKMARLEAGAVAKRVEEKDEEKKAIQQAEDAREADMAESGMGEAVAAVVVPMTTEYGMQNVALEDGSVESVESVETHVENADVQAAANAARENEV